MKHDKELVRRAKQGETDAFACLYQEIYEDLYRFACYTLKNSADAQDAVSETVMDAFASIRTLRAEDAFKSWMFRILSNKCKKKLKEYAGRNVAWPEELDRQAAVPESSADAAELLQVRMLFLELPPQDRMIIAMHLFAGYTGREIAKQLHMNENTVRSRESRALKKMKEKFLKK
ncbi:MAG: RNA polymerase sigma factor [Eubacterium sp.]|jgi:RNA polymerase sigma factor (sigma-70 family)|nr:RNA polymerase sigma factor [Eubacterium sp.]